MSRPHTNVFLVVGGRGTGKTTFIQSQIEKSTQRRQVVIDTFKSPPYKHFPNLEDITQVSRFTGNLHYGSSDVEEQFENIQKYVRNAYLVFEDSARYVDQNPQKPLKNIVLDAKQRNNDVVFVYHSLGEVPPKLFKWVDYIILFKTQENIHAQRSRIFCFDRLLSVHQKVAKSSNKYHREWFEVY